MSHPDHLSRGTNAGDLTLLRTFADGARKDVPNKDSAAPLQRSRLGQKQQQLQLQELQGELLLELQVSRKARLAWIDLKQTLVTSPGYSPKNL